MKIELTLEQICVLEAQHRHSIARCICDRIRCVLLSAQGWSVAMIATSLLINKTTVRRHLLDWLNDEKLTPENGGYRSHLNEAQTTELIAYLTENLHPPHRR